MKTTRQYLHRLLATVAVTAATLTSVFSAETKKPNIVVIWGNDIGMWNVGLYTPA